MAKTTKTKSKPRILIVEDDPAVMKRFSTVLSESGYDVIEATHGLPAMFRVVRTPPDLILADLHMPLLNGLELLDQFKSCDETRDIPVVVVTGSATPQDRDRAFKAGCAGYITKPIDIVKFPAQVAKFLRARPDPT